MYHPITSDYEIVVSLLQLDDNLSYKNYVNGLAKIFIDQCDKSKSKWRSDHVRPK
jgi:hypothetical protein